MTKLPIVCSQSFYGDPRFFLCISGSLSCSSGFAWLAPIQLVGDRIALLHTALSLFASLDSKTCKTPSICFGTRVRRLKMRSGSRWAWSCPRSDLRCCSAFSLLPLGSAIASPCEGCQFIRLCRIRSSWFFEGACRVALLVWCAMSHVQLRFQVLVSDTRSFLRFLAWVAWSLRRLWQHGARKVLLGLCFAFLQNRMSRNEKSYRKKLSTQHTRFTSVWVFAFSHLFFVSRMPVHQLPAW